MGSGASLAENGCPLVRKRTRIPLCHPPEKLAVIGVRDVNVNAGRDSSPHSRLRPGIGSRVEYSVANLELIGARKGALGGAGELGLSFPVLSSMPDKNLEEIRFLPPQGACNP